MIDMMIIIQEPAVMIYTPRKLIKKLINKINYLILRLPIRNVWKIDIKMLLKEFLKINKSLRFIAENIKNLRAAWKNVERKKTFFIPLLLSLKVFYDY